MILAAKYNGINFSYDFNREIEGYNFNLQRKKCFVNRNKTVEFLSFITDIDVELGDCSLTAKYIGTNLSDSVIEADSITEIGTQKIVYFSIAPDTVLNLWQNVQFVVDFSGEKIYSEICNVIDDDFAGENNIFHLIASNDDDRFGYLSNEIFGFFEVSQFKSDFFINKKTEYEGTYGRKRILKSENQIGKRFVFKNLSMYQQNLLKFLCNCQNLSINGTDYYLISEFTEVLADPNSEIMDLQADFVEVNQSFFGEASTKPAKEILTNNFFMK